MSKPTITESRIYFLVVLLISAATLRHSAIGFASFEGNIWLGILSALAIDGLMVLFMYTLRREFRWRLFLAMCVPMLISVFTQLLFAMEHAQTIPVAPGAMWLEQRAVDIINARVWLLPVSLPVSALLAALVGENQQEETVPIGQLRDLQDRNRNLQRDLDAVQGADATTQAELADLRKANQEHQQFIEWIREPKHFETATSFGKWVYTLTERLSMNGSEPLPGVLAEYTGKTRQVFDKVKQARKKAELES